LRSALGSVSHHVLCNAPCPVLVTPEPPRNALLTELSATLQADLA
jgi:hypothetical protein